MAVIKEYAEARNLSIVRTYADRGISGLRAENRPALRNLLFRLASSRRSQMCWPSQTKKKQGSGSSGKSMECGRGQSKALRVLKLRV